MSALFALEDGRYVPSADPAGPWDPGAQHGGAVAALLTDAFERRDEVAGLAAGRLSFEFLRPVPVAPLVLELELVRPGRRVVELGARLHAGGAEVCRAAALFLSPVAADLPAADPQAPDPMPGPQSGREYAFGLDREAAQGARGFAPRALEMRFLDEPFAPGPARVWMRPALELFAGRPLSALARLAATADFGNGVAAPLPFAEYIFINADLSIHLMRAPRGEWIGLDARTHVAGGGVGLSESLVHDEHGPVARAFQSLVVAPRG
jgi:acyl-CoA thioesterase